MSKSSDVKRGTARIYDEEGRTVLPKVAREELGISKGDEFECIVVNGTVQVVNNEDG